MFIRLLQHLGWEHGINTTVLPTYEMLVERYNESSDKILARLPQHSFVVQSGKVMADVNMVANADDTQQLIYIILYFAHYFYLGFHFLNALSILLVCGTLPEGNLWKLKLFPLFLIIHFCSAELALILTFALIRLRLV